MLKRLLFILFVFTTVCLHAQEADDLVRDANDTIHIYFERNVEALNAGSRSLIDSIMSSGYISSNDYLYIVGYADYLGNEEHNMHLSEARAKNVSDFLADYNVKKSNIKLCLGKGQVERVVQKNPDGFPADRRVDIVIINAYTPDNEPTLATRPGKTAKKTGRIQVAEEYTADHHHPKKTGQRTESRILEDDPGNVDIVVKPGTHKGIPDGFKKEPKDKKVLTDLSKYKKGETIVLENIYFYPESHMIRDQSLPELQKLYFLLQKNPKVKIRIEGHVCCVTDVDDAFDIDSKNNHLSLNRAKYIYDYLLSKGITAERLQYTGFGRSKPVVAVELNEVDANKNRRVEIRIMDK